MSSVTVTEQVQDVNVTENVTEIALVQTAQGIGIEKVIHELAVNPLVQQVTVTESPFEITVAAGVPGPQGPQGEPGPDPTWGGIGGTLADQGDLQSALDSKADMVDLSDYFLINNYFSEIQTAQEKIDARDNLGLNVIDGGTFV